MGAVPESRDGPGEGDSQGGRRGRAGQGRRGRGLSLLPPFRYAASLPSPPFNQSPPPRRVCSLLCRASTPLSPRRLAHACMSTNEDQEGMQGVILDNLAALEGLQPGFCEARRTGHMTKLLS